MYEKFDKLTTKLLNSIIVAVLLIIVGFSICATFLYNSLDFKYATEEDYEPLYKIQQTIINDFNTVYTFPNTDIDIKDSKIIVYIFGDDCYLEAHFDKTTTFQHTEKIDKTDPIWSSVFILIVGTIVGGFMFYMLFAVGLVIILLILKKVFNNKNNTERDI